MYYIFGSVAVFVFLNAGTYYATSTDFIVILLSQLSVPKKVSHELSHPGKNVYIAYNQGSADTVLHMQVFTKYCHIIYRVCETRRHQKFP